jgi:hypothetical protein
VCHKCDLAAIESRNQKHRPPCPKCHKPVGADEVNGELCPHCEAPISWGITLGTISADLSSISKANDKGHWSIRTDYCKYCRGWDSPVHPYKSLPQYLSFDYDGECSNVKVCDEHLKKFEQEEERRSRSRHRRYLRGQ